MSQDLKELLSSTGAEVLEVGKPTEERIKYHRDVVCQINGILIQIGALAVTATQYIVAAEGHVVTRDLPEISDSLIKIQMISFGLLAHWQPEEAQKLWDAAEDISEGSSRVLVKAVEQLGL